MRVANPALYDNVTKNRAGMSEFPYIVYCVNCQEVFRSRGKESRHILGLAFDIRCDDRTPLIDEKRLNAIRVKRVLKEDVCSADFSASAQEWDRIELIIDDGLAESIDRKLIAFSDMKEAIWNAEATGDKFVDEADGVCQCCLVKPVLTYWVQYKKVRENVFEVFGAYYHRMRIV